MENINIRLQKLELDTVKVITGLQKDVQSLTSEVCKLTDKIEKMTENYVQKEEFLDRCREMDKRIDRANKIGWVRSTLFGVLATVITVIVTFEITKIFRG